MLLKLKGLLEPFGLMRYYTDDWGVYTRHIDPDEHRPGKRHIQKIERKHLTLRTRIKRLTRKTICSSRCCTGIRCSWRTSIRMKSKGQLRR